ncbi:GtrA family protein [Campylobacter sp.]|uniref:GtrA family protein n=1 Tax=Campylobacter sp. TaxID=205 RepID=UPI002A82F6C6|nr:GtrA family protein [Campylobacter sp.]MDY4445894.1 GtrA family protein [Campylobacter sp.]
MIIKETFLYIISGIASVAITLIVYYFCVFTFLDANDAFELQVANVLSWLVAVIFVYFTNRKYVFCSRNSKILKEMCSFFISRVFTLLVDMAIMFVFVSLAHFDDKIFKIISQVIVVVLNYIISKFLIFNKKVNK